MTQNGVREVRLDNGLRVLVKETHNAPVTSFWLWYKVGSRNEVQGHTGISHWVEHMMFKGTETFPKGAIDREIARLGGSFNAMTWIDFTAYYVTLPAPQIALALDIESDRMINSQFVPEEVESERTVILSERHMYENHPTFLLSEEVTAAAFFVHPYRHEVIGWESDLLSMTREDLYSHYRTYYTPNNTTAIAVGDFQSDAMVDMIAERFGDVPKGPEIPGVSFEEPAQRGERRVNVSGPGSTRYLKMSYRVPPATEDDWFALAVLDTVLAGAQSFSMRGPSPNTRSARLYRALVDSGLVAGVNTSLIPTIDPYLYSFTVTLLPDSDADRVEQALLEELAKPAEEAITQAEFEKARKQTRAQFAFNAESVSNQAYWMGFASTIDDLGWFTHFLDRIEDVTIDDVKRVAQTYLVPERRTVGWYHPTANGEE